MNPTPEQTAREIVKEIQKASLEAWHPHDIHLAEQTFAAHLQSLHDQSEREKDELRGAIVASRQDCEHEKEGLICSLDRCIENQDPRRRLRPHPFRAD